VTRPAPVRIRHIAVVGLMSAGKRTVGSSLAARLGWALRDSDTELSSTTGLTARQIHDNEGTLALHEAEAHELLRALAEPGPNVICPAASVIDDPAARLALAAADVVVIWLRASPAVLAQRFSSAAHRPVYGSDPEEVARAQGELRNPHFAALDPITIDVDRLEPAAVIEKALDAILSVADPEGPRGLATVGALDRRGPARLSSRPRRRH